MNELLIFGILLFTAFFNLINALGIITIFMTLTADLTSKQRNHMAQKATIVTFLTFLCFAFTGQIMFNFFGISAYSFRIAGGIIFFMIGMDMLQARFGKVKIFDAEVKKYDNEFPSLHWLSL